MAVDYFPAVAAVWSRLFYNLQTLKHHMVMMPSTEQPLSRGHGAAVSVISSWLLGRALVYDSLERYYNQQPHPLFGFSLNGVVYVRFCCIVPLLLILVGFCVVLGANGKEIPAPLLRARGVLDRPLRRIFAPDTGHFAFIAVAFESRGSTTHHHTTTAPPIDRHVVRHSINIITTIHRFLLFTET